MLIIKKVIVTMMSSDEMEKNQYSETVKEIRN